MPKRQTQRIIDSRTPNRSTNISGVTLTSPGTTVTAGDGLTLTDTTLDVGAGDGISVAADAVAVDSTVVRTTRTVTAGSGLTGGGALSSDLTLNVGAGTLLTVGADTVGITAGANYQFIGTGSGTAAAWQNLSGLAGNGLTHAAGVLAVGVSGLGLSVAADAVTLTSSSNPGAAASILASTAAGGLTLVSLGVTGAATVGGDFTVGANVLFVNQSGTRVGINRAPDSQFDLDVAGAIRGQYLIGRHAIQLASAVGVWHFDGSAPYNLDFTGSNASHMGVGGTESGGVIYRPGRYGKAVQVATGTTNLFLDPSCEYDSGLSQWSKYTSAGTFTAARSTAIAPLYGDYVAELVCSASAAGLFFQSLTPAAGVCVVTAYICKADGSAITSADANLYIGADLTTTYTDIGGGWWRMVATTTASGSATDIGVRVAAGKTLYVDALMCEPLRTMQGPYCDGSLGQGHAWSGTAMLSSSTRTSAALGYSIGTIAYNAPLTIMAWVNLDTTTPANYQYIWYAASDAYSAYRTAAGILIVGGINCGAWPGGWVHVALTTAGAGSVTAYVNGVAAGSGSITRANISTFNVGGQSGGNRSEGLLDEFVLTDYAADAKLIRAIYESDAPVFVESSVFHWRAPSRVPIWVDEFGLWARGVSGNEILGLYGGDPRNPAGGVTKSWGGVTMSENDIVIGRASGGYVFWDDSTQVLSVQGTITATAGAIGGWTVDATKLIKDTGTAATSAGLAPSDYPFYAGAVYANRATAPFRVTPAGALTATSGTVGGWTLGATALTAGSGSSTVGLDAGGTNPAIYAGSATPGSAPFRVTPAGVLYAEGADVRGAITASSGSITGFLTLGSSGGIYQGTGTAGSPTTGLKIWNDSGVGRIGGYNGGALQWYAGSDGFFYGGDASNKRFRLGNDSFRGIISTGSTQYPIIFVDDVTVSDWTAAAFTGLLVTSKITTSGSEEIRTTLRSRVSGSDRTTYDSKVTLLAHVDNGSGGWNQSALEVNVLANGGARYMIYGGDYFYLNAYQWFAPVTAPGTPGSGVVLYCDTADGRLKAKNSSGTVTNIT